MLDAVINMLKLYADALNAIASVEEVSGRRADELLKELLASQNFAKLSQRPSPDVFREFMSVLLRLTTLASVQNPLTLSPSEKRIDF
jgi:hypothetical protein